jgi:4-hydroxy-4-methyl-2-oxoglutarate aldolase
MTGLRDRLARLPTAALVDARPGATWLGPAVRPLWRPASLAGPAYTVRTRAGDNRPLHRAIADAPPGAVVAVAVGDLEHAIFGDLLSRVAVGRGVAGLVTDGAVRDSDGIRAAGFPVYCAGVVLRAPSKDDPGRFGEPVVLGEAVVAPGDWLVGDSDGVVVLPGASAEAVAVAAEAVEAREAQIVDRAARGEPTPRQLGL